MVRFRLPLVSSQLLSLYFSLFGSFACLAQNALAGGKPIESKNCQVPYLRQPETLEKRNEENSFRRNSALLLPRVRSSFFKVLSCSSFSFFLNAFESKVLKKTETITDVNRKQVEG